MLEENLGRRVVLGIFKVLHGIDRIMTFEQLLAFNGRELAADSPAYDRNLHVLIMQLVGVMHEVGVALQELCNARVADIVGRESESWQRLNAWRRRLKGDGAISDLRAQMAAHLGDREIYDAGLEHLLDTTDPRFLLMHGDGHLRHAGFAVGAWDCLYRGLDLDPEGVKDVLKFTRDAHFDLPGAFMDFLTELFMASRIEVVDELSPRTRRSFGGLLVRAADTALRRIARKIRRLATAVEGRSRMPV